MYLKKIYSTCIHFANNWDGKSTGIFWYYISLPPAPATHTDCTHCTQFFLWLPLPALLSYNYNKILQLQRARVDCLADLAFHFLCLLYLCYIRCLIYIAGQGSVDSHLMLWTEWFCQCFHNDTSEAFRITLEKLSVISFKLARIPLKCSLYNVFWLVYCISLRLKGFSQFKDGSAQLACSPD